MKWKLTFWALGAVVLIAGCGGKKAEQSTSATKTPPVAELKPGEETSLFPLVVGNEWTYSLENTVSIPGRSIPTRRASLTFKVVSAKPVADGVRGTIQVLQGNKKVDTQVWESTKRGISQLTSGLGQVPYTPQMPAVLFPVEKNKKFGWKGTGIQMGDIKGVGKLDYTVMGMQLVDTDMGPMSALCVDCLGTFQVSGKSGAQKSTSWWSPKVGLVRYFSQAGMKGFISTTVLRLQNYYVK